MSKLILFTSQKRETGKSILAAKTAAELSKRSHKVALVDLSDGKIKLSEYLRVDEDIIYDVKDVLDGVCSSDQAAIQAAENLHILPYPRVSGKLKEISSKSFAHMRAELDEFYDVIIVDMDSLLNGYFLAGQVISCAVLVNNSDFSTVTQVMGEKDLAQRLYGVENVLTVINRYNKSKSSGGSEMRHNDIKKLIDTGIAGIIEEDKNYESPDYDFIFTNEPNTMCQVVGHLADNIV